MIPSNPDEFKKMRELAARNIAKGDWGDEITLAGLPDETKPFSPEEHEARSTVFNILVKRGGLKLPKRKGN
jgi:hypothetical protein